MSYRTTAPARSRRREVALLAALGFATIAAVAAIAFGGTSELMGGTDGVGSVLFPVFGTLGYTAVGAMILWRRPSNGIGRLALAIGLSLSVSAVLGALVAGMTPDGFVRPVVPGLLNWVFDMATHVSNALLAGALIIGTIVLITWFPSGRRASRLGGLIELAVIVAIGMAALTLVRVPVLRATDWPTALIAIYDWLPAIALLLVFGAWLASILDLALRYRRSSPVERVQIRWVLAAVVVSAVLLFVVITYSESINGLWELWIASTILPIFAIALAITRYRLYDIDRIVSRSITYAVITAVLFGVFFAVNVVLQQVIGGVVGDVVGDSPVVVAASTLAVAALFTPLRARVQVAVDRRFHRARYDAERTVSGFTGRLRDQLDLPTLTAELRRTTVEAVDPSATTIWLRTPRAEPR